MIDISQYILTAAVFVERYTDLIFTLYISYLVSNENWTCCQSVFAPYFMSVYGG